MPTGVLVRKAVRALPQVGWWRPQGGPACQRCWGHTPPSAPASLSSAADLPHAHLQQYAHDFPHVSNHSPIQLFICTFPFIYLVRSFVQTPIHPSVQ